MPFVNGRYYMNPFYGRALEAAREAENRASDRDAGEPDANGHWVTIDHRHVLIHEPPENTGRIDRKPGTKLARIIFNETAGLRATDKDSEQLHDARVAIAHALLNGAGMKHPPATVIDVLTPSAARAILTDPDAKSAWKDAEAAAREAMQTPDDTAGAVHFFLDHPGAAHPNWATPNREAGIYGPFVNSAGGGDVPRGARVTIRIYTERPRR